MSVNDNTLVSVTNRDLGRVGYSIPSLNVRRIFLPNETQNVQFVELKRLVYISGGLDILTKCLVINDSEAATAIQQIIGTKPTPDWDDELPNSGDNNSGGTGVLEITVTYVEEDELLRMDKTFQEIVDAFEAGKICIAKKIETYFSKTDQGEILYEETHTYIYMMQGYNTYIISSENEEYRTSNYSVDFGDGGSFSAHSPDEYPYQSY